MILTLNIYGLIHKFSHRRLVIITLSAILLAVAAYATTQSVAYAAPLQPDTVVASLSAGFSHNCEIKNDGTLSCWGLDDDGEVSGIPAGLFTQVAAGEYHTCAIKNDGTLACWGDDSEGQSSPPSGTFTQVSVGAIHSCAIKSNDTVKCWGNNDDGQSSPPSGTFKQISAGSYHNCGIKSDDTLKCWGNNDETQSTPPTGTFKQVSAGDIHTCAIKTDNTVTCWGNNDDLQASPLAGAFTQISAGSAHTCAIKSDGTVACWGDNSEGQASPPTGIFLKIEAGDLHTCGIRSDGTVACWGNNDDGQAPIIALNPAILPNSQLGVAYSQPITVSAENYTPTVPSLTLSSGLLPAGLTLGGTPGNSVINGTPTTGGAFVFTLRAIDANGLSGESTFSLKVNRAPVANNQNITVQQNTPRAILLTASDPENDALTYVIVNSPAHGALTGAAGAMINYTPANNYSGSDSFTFKTNDGQADSNVATININVTAAQTTNTPPIANPQNVTTLRNLASSITLVASDADNNPLSYTLVSNPAHGALSGTPPKLIYTPTVGFTGADSFTFKANDGKADSNTAIINITVVGNNTAPVADNQNVFTERTVSKAITLTASDNENDALTYVVLGNPISGTLSGTPPHLLYTPNNNLVGAAIDTFTFKVNDGLADSNVATVKITLLPPGVPAPYSPVANSQNIVTSRNTPRAITLVASDATNDHLTYTLLSTPKHGVLSGDAPNLTYTPSTGFGGADSFTFKVTNSRQDGNQDSNVATVNILVAGSNTAPVADDQNVTTPQNTAKNVLLSASDADNDTLLYTKISDPAHGTLSGTPPNLAYTPATGYTGADSFTFKANDGTADSNIATVNISVTATVAPNTSPIADDQTITTAQETAKNITLTGSDADNNPLTYTVVGNPAHGTLSGTAQNLTYTPNAGFNGDDSFTFKVNDGQADSNVATIHITVVASLLEGSITGTVYNDKNLNGQQDPSERGIANVTVILNNATDNAVTVASPANATAERRTTTNADGVYRFAQVPAGNYTIKIELPPNFEVAGPAQFSITVGSTGQTTAPPIAIKGYNILLPLIRK